MTGHSLTLLGAPRTRTRAISHDKVIAAIFFTTTVLYINILLLRALPEVSVIYCPQIILFIKVFCVPGHKRLWSYWQRPGRNVKCELWAVLRWDCPRKLYAIHFPPREIGTNIMVKCINSIKNHSLKFRIRVEEVTVY